MQMQKKVSKTKITSNFNYNKLNNNEDSISIKNLKKYLIAKYGSDVIIDSEDISDKNSDFYIDKTKLFDITYKTFLEDYKSQHNENYITIKQLVDFLLGENDICANTNATCGKYHEFMPMTFALCNVSIKNEMPCYENISQTLRDKIKPRREEYLICWWILYKISNDQFIKNFLFVDKKKFAWPTFQHNYNGRIYDVSFDQLKIVIEIQEDKIAHKNNLNDKLKETIVKFGGKRIKYFKLQEFNALRNDYLDEFWNNTIKKCLIEALLYTSYEVRKSFSSYRFTEICKEDMNKIHNEMFILHNEIKSLNKEQSQHKICQNKILRFTVLQKKSEQLDGFIKQSNTSLIYKLFSWKNEAEKKNDQYIININDIAKYLNFKSKEIDQLKELIYIKGIIYKEKIVYDNDEIEIEIFITWQSLVEILKLSDISDNQLAIKQLDHYLINIEKIYEEIISKIKIHTNEIINNNIINNEQYEKYIKEKTEEPLNKQIKKLETEIEAYKYQVKNICKDIKKLTNLAKKQNEICDKITTSKKDIKYNNDIKEIANNLKNYHTNNIGKTITIQKIVGQSIIKEIPEFPIVYTDNISNKLIYNNFVGICNAYLISSQNQKKICQELFSDFDINISNIQILHYIKDISDDENYEINNKEITLDEILKKDYNINEIIKDNIKNNDSDSDLNIESSEKINSDSESDSDNSYDF